MRKIYDLLTELKLFGIMFRLGKDEEQTHGNSYLGHIRIFRITKHFAIFISLLHSEFLTLF